MFFTVQAPIRKHIENCQIKNQVNSDPRQIIAWTFGSTTVLVKQPVKMLLK